MDKFVWIVTWALVLGSAVQVVIDVGWTALTALVTVGGGCLWMWWGERA